MGGKERRGNRKMPATRRRLIEAKGRLDHGTRLGRATWAAMLVQYFFMLRANNMVAPDSALYDPGGILRRQDVTFLTADK